MKKTKRVALKYCGGCDPGFDRVEYIQRIRAAAGKSIMWVTLDGENIDTVLLVSGCDTACPERNVELSPHRIVSITDDHAAPEQIVATLLSEGEQ